MKLSKTIMALAAVLTSVSALHATDYIYLTGSTAYRSATENAINGLFDSGSLVYGYDTGSGTYGKNNYAIYHGTIAGNDTIIETSWSGSEAGIQAVAAGIPVKYLDPASLSATLTSGGTYGLTASASTLSLHTPIIAMSDTAQTASQFAPGVAYNVYVNSTTYSGTYGTLSNGDAVGVVPFKFVASKGSTLTNITPQLVKALYSGGKLPLALFTGLNADETKIVFATGRNPDSGTRVTTVLETKFGTAVSGVKQYQLVDSSWNLVTTNTTPVNALIPWPTDTVNGISIAKFNSGYSSGGKLAAALAQTLPNPINLYSNVTSSSSNNGTGTGSGTLTTPSNGGVVAYLSASDADSYIAAGNLVELSYNGVLLDTPAHSGFPYATNPKLVEGAYTFWSYEHIYAVNGLTGNAATIVSNLIAAFPTVNGVTKVSDLKVTRGLDGGVVTNNY